MKSHDTTSIPDADKALLAPPASDLMRILQYLQRIAARYRSMHRQTRRVAALRLHAYEKNGKRYYCARTKQDGKWKDSYLGTARHPVVRQLQKRRLLEKLISNIEQDIRLLETCIAELKPIQPDVIMAAIPKAYQADPLELLSHAAKGAYGYDNGSSGGDGGYGPDHPAFAMVHDLLAAHDMRLLQRKKELHPEHLTHRTARGQFVRSKSEVVIANSLFARELLYLNEPLIEFRGSFLAPDFLILSPHDYSIVFWEHWGLLSKPGYLERNVEKLKDYQAAGFTPGNNLIITSDTLDGDLDSYQIERILDAWFK